MLSSCEALKRSQQKQVHTAMRSAVRRQGREVSMARVAPAPGTVTVTILLGEALTLSAFSAPPSSVPSHYSLKNVPLLV